MLSPGYSTIEPGNERSLSTYVNEDGKVRRALNTPEHSTVRIYNLNILHLTSLGKVILVMTQHEHEPVGQRIIKFNARSNCRHGV